MLPQSEFDSPMLANAPAPVAIAAITQDRALIGLLRSVVDPATDLILVTSEAELVPHLNSRRVSVALLDSMFIEGDLAGLAERLRETWPDLVLVVVGTAEEQSKVASQITSGVVYRFLHRPVSAPRVRLFVEAALRRHEVENVERTLEQVRPDFSRHRGAEIRRATRRSGKPVAAYAIGGLALAAATVGGWYLFSGGKSPETRRPVAQVVSQPADGRGSAPRWPREPAPDRHRPPPAALPSRRPMPAPPPAAAEARRDAAPGRQRLQSAAPPRPLHRRQLTAHRPGRDRVEAPVRGPRATEDAGGESPRPSHRRPRP